MMDNKLMNNATVINNELDPKQDYYFIHHEQHKHL